MRKEAAIAAVFLTPMILFTVLGAVLPHKIFSEEENRYLAEKPSFTLNSLKEGSYGRAYETWLSDQFPFRRTFVAAKTNAERLILREDVNDVYFCRDHYYIEKIDSEDLITEQLSQNLEYLSASVEKLISIVGKEHIKVMLVPSASQILKDKLPPFAAPADQGRVTEMAQEKIRKKTGEDGILLNIEEELINARERQGKTASKLWPEEELFYYKTDHHWTTHGAYTAYLMYGRAAGFEPLERNDFTEEIVSRTFLGTIQSKLGVSLEPDVIRLFIPVFQTEYKVYYDGTAESADTLYNLKALEKKDQYAVFFDGNHSWTKIVNEKAGEEAKRRKLLIVKDSYAHSFAPFVINHFEEVHMIDLRYFNMKLSRFTEEQKFTDILVLYQIPGFAKDVNLFKMLR